MLCQNEIPIDPLGKLQSLVALETEQLAIRPLGLDLCFPGHSNVIQNPEAKRDEDSTRTTVEYVDIFDVQQQQCSTNLEISSATSASAASSAMRSVWI